MFGKETIGKNENSSDPYGWNQEAKKAEAFDINETTLSLAELRDQHPQELKQWALSVGHNGDMAYGSMRTTQACRKLIPGALELREWKPGYGADIKDGPFLQPSDFRQAVEDKNPGKTVLMFKKKLENDEKVGADYYLVVDCDIDELELPDGYGFCSVADGMEGHYRSSIDKDHADNKADYSIRHWKTVKESPQLKYNNDNAVHNEVCAPLDGGGQMFFPEEYRFRIKKPAGE